MQARRFRNAGNIRNTGWCSDLPIGRIKDVKESVWAMSIEPTVISVRVET